MSATNDFFIKHYVPREDPMRGWEMFPRIHCVDGFHMSVQGHIGAYCQPRVGFDEARHHCGGFYSVEVGFPSEREELLMPYVEDENDPTGTVYGYVPVTIVDEVIAKHGGLKS